MRLFDLHEQVAVVTGGNGGIGYAIAAGLAEAGARVVIAGRDAAKNARAVAELGGLASALTVDIGQPESCTAMIDAVLSHCGKLDILVNNAGINVRGQPNVISSADWDRVMAVNLRGTFSCSQAAYPAMKQAGRGKILNISSMGTLFGQPFVAPYAASKAGVLQMTKTLAVAWAKDNIQVNAILPGWIDTELTAAARRQVPGISERVAARTPLGRWGKPEDIAGAAIYLCSAAADFVTGASLTIDGGYSIEG